MKNKTEIKIEVEDNFAWIFINGEHSFCSRHRKELISRLNGVLFGLMGKEENE